MARLERGIRPALASVVLSFAPHLAPLAATAVAVTACTFSPPEDWTHYELGQKLRTDGDYQNAIQEYRAFIAEDPHSNLAPDAQSKIAICYFNLKDPADELAAYRELVANYPDSIEARDAQFAIADLCRQLKDYPTAIKEYQTFISKYPNDKQAPSAQWSIASIYHLDLKQPYDAIEAYQALINNYPNAIEAQFGRYYLATVYDVSLQSYGPAASAYQDFIGNYSNPDDNTALAASLARCLADAKNRLAQLCQQGYCVNS